MTIREHDVITVKMECLVNKQILNNSEIDLPMNGINGEGSCTKSIVRLGKADFSDENNFIS